MPAGTKHVTHFVASEHLTNNPAGDKWIFDMPMVDQGDNAKTKEILYTDSWGPGHELKRMPLGDAWAKTFALYGIRP